MQKTTKHFLNDIVADLGHTFKLFHEGVPKKVFRKNIVFCKTYVEIWAFEGKQLEFTGLESRHLDTQKYKSLIPPRPYVTIYSSEL